MTAFPDLNPEAIRRRRIPLFRSQRNPFTGLVRFHQSTPNSTQLEYSFDFSLLSQAERDSIDDHYLDHCTTNFSFFDPLFRRRVNGFVGTGTGAQTVFTLPAKEIAGLVVRVGGTPTAVTLLIGTGPEGEDQIQFAVPPGAGLEIRFDATKARERVTVYYDPASTTLDDGHLEAEIYVLSGIKLLQRVA